MKKKLNLLIGISILSFSTIGLASCDNGPDQPASSESESNIQETGSEEKFTLDAKFLNNVKDSLLTIDKYLKIDLLEFANADNEKEGLVDSKLYFTVENDHINGSVVLRKYFEPLNDYLDTYVRIENGNCWISEAKEGEYFIDIFDESGEAAKEKVTKYVENIVTSETVDSYFAGYGLKESSLIDLYDTAIGTIKAFEVVDDSLALKYLTCNENANNIKIQVNYDKIDALIDSLYDAYQNKKVCELVDMAFGPDTYASLEKNIPVYTAITVKNVFSYLADKGFDINEILNYIYNSLEPDSGFSYQIKSILTSLNNEEFLNTSIGNLVIGLFNLVDENNEPLTLDELNDKLIELKDTVKDLKLPEALDTISGSTSISDKITSIMEEYETDFLPNLKTSNISLTADKTGKFVEANMKYQSEDTKFDISLVKGNFTFETSNISNVSFDYDKLYLSYCNYLTSKDSGERCKPEDIIYENEKPIGYVRQFNPGTYISEKNGQSCVCVEEVYDVRRYFTTSYFYYQYDSYYLTTPVFKDIVKIKETDYYYASTQDAVDAESKGDYSTALRSENVEINKEYYYKGCLNFIYCSDNDGTYTILESFDYGDYEIVSTTDPVGEYGSSDFIYGKIIYKSGYGYNYTKYFYIRDKADNGDNDLPLN